ncbi:uncharacterized protein LOC141851464 [Brevipalpus obovatus]|uniref:uncharacterized protein LOC141851464 n=1 Tax=Brevipalpus obovatus TaxID=246614 RepID=UPI003D9EB69F
MGGWKVVAAPLSQNVIAASGNVGHQLVGIVECYSRPWKGRLDKTIETSEQIMLDCLPGHSTIFLADLNTENSRWSMKKNRPCADKAINMMERRGLQIVNTPNETNYTFRVGNKVSWLDIIAANWKMKKRCENDIMPVMSSDHLMIMAAVAEKSGVNTQIRYYTDLRQLRKVVKENPLIIEYSDNVMRAESNYSILIAHVSNLVAKCTRITRGAQDIEVIELAKRKKILRRKLSRIKPSNLNYMERAKQLRNALLETKNQMQGLAKRRMRAFESRVERGELDPWKAIEITMGKQWKDFKASFMGWHEKDILESENNYLKLFESKRTKYEPLKKCWPLKSEPLSDNEWEKIIAKISKKKCQFADFLDCKSFSIFLQEDKAVKQYFIDCLRNGAIPLRAFDSKMVLIPKQDGKRVRPIAIMSPVGRVFDCCFHALLMRYPDIDKLPKQWGFRRGVGSSNFFTELITGVAGLQRKQKIVIMLLTIDLENAFENFEIRRCVDALKTKCGDASLAELIGSALMNRVSMIQDKMGNMLYRTLTKGSFQGGFVSPLLFNITSEDVLLKEVRGWKVHTVKYADDILIISEPLRIFTRKPMTLAKDVDIIFRHLEVNCLNEVERRCNEIGLTVNAQKSKSILLTNAPKLKALWDKERNIEVLGVPLNTGSLDKQIMTV